MLMLNLIIASLRAVLVNSLIYVQSLNFIRSEKKVQTRWFQNDSAVNELSFAASTEQ